MQHVLLLVCPCLCLQRKQLFVVLHRIMGMVLVWMKKGDACKLTPCHKSLIDNISITFGSSPGQNVRKAETTPIFTHTHLMGWHAPWWQVWLTIQPFNRSSPPLLEDLTCPMPVCPASECSFCVLLVFSALCLHMLNHMGVWLDILHLL